MKIMILDGNSILNRAFYGTPPLTNRKGQQTGAIYSFLKSLNKLQREHTPDAVCVTFDEKAPTFRHKAFDDYKGKRKKMPEELFSQLVLTKDILKAMHIPFYSMAGWEADDLMGTMSVLSTQENWDCILVTGDKDSLQLASPNTTIHLITSSKSGAKVTHYTPTVFREEFGFEPKYLVDLKALMGDNSDNIPGIKGMGVKNAKPLIQNYKTIDAIYEKLADPEEKLGLTPRMVELLKNGEEICRLSHDLARIRCDAPLEFSPQDCLPEDMDEVAVNELFHELELTKLLDLFKITPIQVEEKNYLEHCTLETAHTLKQVEAQFQQWETQKVALIHLPQLVGFGLYSATEQGGKCLIIQENDFDFYGKFLQLLFSAPFQLIVEDYKALCRLLLDEGISPKNISFDTVVAAYLLSPEQSLYDLKTLATQYLYYDWKEEEPLEEEEPNLFTSPQRSLENLALRTVLLSQLEGILQEELKKNALLPLYFDVELPLCQVLAEIEFQGIAVDAQALSLYEEKISKMLAEIEEKIYAEAGERFNINSPKQLGLILFEKLELPVIKKTKTGYSTNVDVLEKLQEQVPDCLIVRHILEQRHLTKLNSTYAKGLKKVLTPEHKIHTRFQNTTTATGRLSSVEPNLQNIPIRTELGAELRNMFVAQEGNVLIDADYSQIELRLLAHIAEDEAMLNAFRSGEDIHSQTASQVFHVPLAEVTSTMRRSAKAVNFGIVYGISAFALSQDIGVTVAEAQNYINRYFETYPNVKAYLDEVVVQGRENGFVSTLLGRKRWLGDLSSSNFRQRAFSERMAQNTPIQGAAADIIKVAMVSVRNKLLEQGLSGKLVLQVHDELLIQCPQSEGEATAKLVQEAMEGVMELSVPLLAETHIGKNWGEAH